MSRDAGKIRQDQAVSVDDLMRALDIAAQIVARDGEAFLPIFLRLEDEAAARSGAGAAMARARAMAARR